MNRIKLKKRLKIKLSTKIIMTIILFLITLLGCFKYLNYKFSPVLLNYAELEIKRLSTLVITKAVSKHITDELDIEKLFIINKDNDGKILTIDFNSALVNKFLTTTASSVQISLRQIEKGNIDILQLSDDVEVEFDKKKLEEGIIFEIPFGLVYKNALLSNLGPKIPVRLNVMGDITSNIKTKVTNYGINNALVEVFIDIKIDEQVILPFTSKKVTIKSNIPVALKIIEGSVPNYYFNGMQNTSPIISLPTK